MHVLLLGGTGNLGSRVLPALLAHSHAVTALVRDPSKLLRLLPPALSSRVTIVQGDALDPSSIATALRAHDCDAIVNTAGTREPRGHVQTLPLIVAAVTSAAVEVGRERGGALRAWIIGGNGDYFPASMMDHMRGTEAVVRGVKTGELRWSLLCVAMMKPGTGEGERWDEREVGNGLVVAVGKAPGWRDHWVRWVPFVGEYLNLVPVIRSYTAEYEEVADLIAGDLALGSEEYVGQFIGFKAAENQ